MKPAVIAIDGPAGSGKTVVGKRLADDLGYVYLDTGAFYRAITWLALQRGVDVHDGPALARIVQDANLEIGRASADGFPYTILVDEKDVTRELASPEVSKNVSIVAAHPEVRTALLPLQRQVATAAPVVMAGRDIGTVVCPSADLKLYLEAPLPLRVARRIEQLQQMGLSPNPAEVAAQLTERDRLDETRATAPLKPAPDAIILDTSALTIDQEIAYILDLIARRS
jgi:cytidylate kinase